MTGPKITAFDTREQMQTAAVEYLQTALSNALQSNGLATLLCAGGSTPGPIYEQLSEADVDWSRVTVGLTDERWVAEDNAASNAAFLKNTLIRNRAETARFVPMVTNAALNAFHEATEVNTRYTEHFTAPDIAVVGMGTDGHTLSWFLGAEGLGAALDINTDAVIAPIEAIHSAVTGAHTTRMTCTFPVMNRVKQVCLLITGEEKKAVLDTATPDLPIVHLLEAAGSRLTTYWAP